MKTFLRILAAIGIFFWVLFLSVVLSVFIFPESPTPDWYIYISFGLAVVVAVVLLVLLDTRKPKAQTPTPAYRPPAHLNPAVTRPAPAPIKAPVNTTNTLVVLPAITPPVKARTRPLFSGTFYHVSGLNLPADTKCRVSYWPDHLSFSAMNHDFSLSHSKVRGVTKLTHKDIQTQYVSSIGGAVAGAALFGPIGAIIGGSAKQKHVRQYSHYLVFAYGAPEEETKYIILSLSDWSDESRKFVSAYKKSLQNSKTVVEL